MKLWTKKNWNDKNWKNSFRRPFVFATHYLITERPTIDRTLVAAQWKLGNDLMLAIKFNKAETKNIYEITHSGQTSVEAGFQIIACCSQSIEHILFRQKSHLQSLPVAYRL